jgi:hypothetical protein
VDDRRSTSGADPSPQVLLDGADDAPDLVLHAPAVRCEEGDQPGAAVAGVGAICPSPAGASTPS